MTGHRHYTRAYRCRSGRRRPWRGIVSRRELTHAETVVDIHDGVQTVNAVCAAVLDWYVVACTFVMQKRRASWHVHDAVRRAWQVTCQSNKKKTACCLSIQHSLTLKTKPTQYGFIWNYLIHETAYFSRKYTVNLMIWNKINSINLRFLCWYCGNFTYTQIREDYQSKFIKKEINRTKTTFKWTVLSFNDM